MDQRLNVIFVTKKLNFFSVFATFYYFLLDILSNTLYINYMESNKRFTAKNIVGLKFESTNVNAEYTYYNQGFVIYDNQERLYVNYNNIEKLNQRQPSVFGTKKTAQYIADLMNDGSILENEIFFAVGF